MTEEPLPGGWVTQGVVRVGDTVRRPVGPNADRIRRLLERLESIGFEAAPRFLGFDDQGRMTLSFIEGEVPADCGGIVWEDGQLRASAALLRRFHDATTAIAEGAEVVCHNDYGPWNLVWRDQLPIGIIDFDNVAPGRRLDDFGYAVWKHLNLGLIELPVEEQARRLQVMTASYGTSADENLLEAVDRAQERMEKLIGGEPAHDQLSHERSWFKAHAPHLVHSGPGAPGSP